MDIGTGWEKKAKKVTNAILCNLIPMSGPWDYDRSIYQDANRAGNNNF